MDPFKPIKTGKRASQSRAIAPQPSAFSTVEAAPFVQPEFVPQRQPEVLQGELVLEAPAQSAQYGKPHTLQKGYDPRRGTNGGTGPVRRFNRQLREMLVAEGIKKPKDIEGKTGKSRIERVVERLYDEAEAGQGWAMSILFERIEGKVTQPVEVPANTPVLVIQGVSMDEI